MLDDFYPYIDAVTVQTKTSSVLLLPPRAKQREGGVGGNHVARMSYGVQVLVQGWRVQGGGWEGTGVDIIMMEARDNAQPRDPTLCPLLLDPGGFCFLAPVL